MQLWKNILLLITANLVCFCQKRHLKSDISPKPIFAKKIEPVLKRAKKVVKKAISAFNHSQKGEKLYHLN